MIPEHPQHVLTALEHGELSMNACNDHGDGILLHACRREWWKVAKWLVEHGCDVSVVSPVDGRTALEVCAEHPGWPHQVMANVLRQYGARDRPPNPTDDVKVAAMIDGFHLINTTEDDDEVLRRVDDGAIRPSDINSCGDNLLMAAYRQGRWRLARELSTRGFGLKEDK